MGRGSEECVHVVTYGTRPAAPHVHYTMIMRTGTQLVRRDTPSAQLASVEVMYSYVRNTSNLDVGSRPHLIYEYMHVARMHTESQ